MTLLVIFVIFPNIIIGGLSVGFGSNNFNIKCDNKAFVSLAIWLTVTGVVMIIHIITKFILLVKCYSIPNPTKKRKLIFKIMIGIGMIYLIFLIGWNVVGSISFFKYSNECKNIEESLWIMMLITLIFQWLSIIVMVCYNLYNIHILRTRND